MKFSRKNDRVRDVKKYVSLCVILGFLVSLVSFSPASLTASAEAPATTAGVLDGLQNEYDSLEQKIAQSEKNLKTIEAGKTEQKKNISALETQISGLSSQITVLESRISVLSGDIRKLNVSINTLNKEIDRLREEIEETETMIYETQRSIDLLAAKAQSRLAMSYMSGGVSKLEMLVGAKDLYSFFTRIQMIKNITDYDADLMERLTEQLEKVRELDDSLKADMNVLQEKRAALTGEQATLYARQSDIESSAYVLEMKKQLNENKYKEATDYFKTLDKSSGDYNAMLKIFSDEQDKIDAQINAYLLLHGSSADDAVPVEPTAAITVTVSEPEPESETVPTTTERFTTVPFVPQSLFTSATTTTTTTTANYSGGSYSGLDLTVPTTVVNVVSATSTDLIWPMPYKNCYISAYYGEYPSGGAHRGIDICVRGGTEGKNVVAAGNGRVIQRGYNHWSMGNYIILDHGYGLFTAYYHLQVLYVDLNDVVSQGKVIGLAGNTGNSTGPHLHFEVRVSKGGSITYTDPFKWVKMPS
ncbi:MAG: peptidoglycan DD-metalloendopeptidase family protein [Oscillospiraceae bacterium]|nr:peptidoglycan DD-metalloendopeptidase family protein [Oscillospiraceae bacterium]